LSAWGLTPEDVEPDPVEVWPDHWPVVRLFAQMTGQWRIGFNGPTGLDYSFAFSRMDRMQLDPAAYDEMLDALHVMEMAALDELKEGKEASCPNP
jgi:hypothetical protein